MSRAERQDRVIRWVLIVSAALAALTLLVAAISLPALGDDARLLELAPLSAERRLILSAAAEDYDQGTMPATSR